MRSMELLLPKKMMHMQTRWNKEREEETFHCNVRSNLHNRRAAGRIIIQGMKKISHLFQGGSSSRALPIDESSDRWKERSGRLSGSQTYVAGDVCRSVFRAATSQAHSERDAIYGGPALIVGIIEARGIGCVGPKATT